MIDYQGVRIPAAPFEWARAADLSQSVLAGDLIFISGQGGGTPSGEVVSDDLTAQVRQTFENIKMILAQYDRSLESVVKLTVFVAGPAEYEAFKTVRREYFAAPWPASTVVAAQILIPGWRIEIEAVASMRATRTLR